MDFNDVMSQEAVPYSGIPKTDQKDGSKDGPLNNDPSWRSVSDKLDSALGEGYEDKESSKTR